MVYCVPKKGVTLVDWCFCSPDPWPRSRAQHREGTGGDVPQGLRELALRLSWGLANLTHLCGGRKPASSGLSSTWDTLIRGPAKPLRGGGLRGSCGCISKQTGGCPCHHPHKPHPGFCPRTSQPVGKPISWCQWVGGKCLLRYWDARKLTSLVHLSRSSADGAGWRRMVTMALKGVVSIEPQRQEPEQRCLRKEQRQVGWKGTFPINWEK